jgi:hypothetical protein
MHPNIMGCMVTYQHGNQNVRKRDIRRRVKMPETTVSKKVISEGIALRILVKNFVDDNKIYCAESVWQTDCVSENALEFIELLCDIAGYYNE